MRGRKITGILALGLGILFTLGSTHWDRTTLPVGSGGLLIVPTEKRGSDRIFRIARRSFPDAFLVPVRFLGVYETKAKKAYKRRALTVLIAGPRLLHALALAPETPLVLLGPGIPLTFDPSKLGAWKEALRGWEKGPPVRLPASVRALKWTVVLVTSEPKGIGKPAWFLLPREWDRRSLRSLFSALSVPVGVSVRAPLRFALAFWITWFGFVFLFFGGHLLLRDLWERWEKWAGAKALLRERNLYDSIAAVYFALYLTAVGVIYNRPDFQDALTFPLRSLVTPSIPFQLITCLPLALFNWFVQVMTIMLPSALLPPVGILIGHLRGMVEQALTTAPIAQFGGGSPLPFGIAVFLQGEATVAAMLWSALVTRAVIAPKTFGFETYWDAYKAAWQDFLPLIQVTGALTFMATLMGTIAALS